MNKIEIVTSELSECHKLKDLHLQDNLMKDSRLVVLDYIATRSEKGKAGKKGGKKGRNKRVSEGDNEVTEDQAETQVVSQVVRVLYSEEFKVLVQPSVQAVRPYIVCALVRNLDLSDTNAFKKFITIQVRIHSLFKLSHFDLNAVLYITFCLLNRMWKTNL